ncbi:FUSC family protein [Streptomyces sp. NPDC001339]|uniref:FUSC family protein n=1 Tax=Streptomyces sp. NPDC001339 TaxID=3364563 RepID=UPI00367E16FD
MRSQLGASPRRTADGPVGSVPLRAGLRRLRYLREHGRHALHTQRPVVGTAVRVTVAACTAFYLCRYGLGLTVMSLYATFTVVALGALARIPGSGRQRAETLLTAVPAGLALVGLGTLLAVRTWAAVLGMLVVGFLVAYAGTTGPRVAAAAPGMQLLYILPCFPPYAPDTLAQRLAGYLLGTVLLVLAQRFVLPEPATPPFRRLLAEAADAAADLAEHRGGPAPGPALARADAAAEALRPDRVPPADMPAAPTLANKALVHTAEAVRTLLARLAAVHTTAGAYRAFRPQTAALLRTVGATARETARALRENERRWVRVGALPPRRARLRPGMGRPSATALQNELAPARTRRALEALDRLSADEQLARLRRRSLVVQAADAAVTLVLATRLLLGDRSVDRNPGGHSFTYARARATELWRQRLATHLTPRSVIFQNACRFALGLAAARAVAGVLNLQHGFWVLLATLTLIRTTSLETRTAVRQALIGTLLGAGLAAGLLAAVHDRPVVYAVVLPPLMLVAFLVGPLRGLAWAQGGFTLVVALLFAQVSPVTWLLAPVRVEDVLIGSVIGLVCGLVAWPRGAGREVRRSMADLCAAVADAIGWTTTRIVDRTTAGVPAAGGSAAGIAAINRALILAQESLAQFESEPRTEPDRQPDWLAVVVAGADARRGERMLPGRPGRIDRREVGSWLRQASGTTAAAYRDLSRRLRTDHGAPPPPLGAPPALDIHALLAVVPHIPQDVPDQDARAVSAALLVDSVIWLDALTADLARIHREL